MITHLILNTQKPPKITEDFSCVVCSGFMVQEPADYIMIFKDSDLSNVFAFFGVCLMHSRMYGTRLLDFKFVQDLGLNLRIHSSCASGRKEFVTNLIEKIIFNDIMKS